MAFQSGARKVWQDAKKKAGDALKELKFKDGYGPMLDEYEKLDAKVDKMVSELDKLQGERLTLQQKLVDTRNDYVTKIERAKIPADVKESLINAFQVAFDKANHVKGKGGFQITI